MAPAAKKSNEQPKETAKRSKVDIGRFDPYIGSKSVTGLDRYNFEEFVNDKDICLVMFYEPFQPESDWSKKHFIRAAKTTLREGHAYAAMDCVKESEMCKEEEADQPYPLFKLYSRGTLIETYKNNRTFLYTIMKKFVENAPLIAPQERPKRPCDQ